MTNINIRPLEVTTQGDREVVMRRTFNAPRHLVFDAHTKCELLQRWIGPHGWTLPECDIDLRVGGTFRFKGRGPDGMEMAWGGTYREIVPNERLTSTEAFEDNWTGGETVNTAVFEEHAGRTTLTTTVRYASKEARDTALATPWESGVSQGYERLDEVLAELQRSG